MVFEVDVLEKGIMNLTDLLADLHQSHNVALEKPGVAVFFDGDGGPPVVMRDIPHIFPIQWGAVWSYEQSFPTI